MNRSFLDLYKQELAYIRTMGSEFAREYPKIAGRLGGIDEVQTCPDPFVERLLEGFAFLAARVQYKIEAEFPRFTQSLLETIYPHFLCPIPSMGIVQFQPEINDPGLAQGFPIPRGSSLLSKLGKSEQTRCKYRTAHDVFLLPLNLTQANYYIQEISTLQLPSSQTNVKAALRLRLQCFTANSFREVNLDRLNLYLMGADEISMLLYEQLSTDLEGVVIQTAKRPVKWQKSLAASSLELSGFHENQSLLPYDAQSFQGYRLLQEHFAFPERFMFMELRDLKAALSTCEEKEIDILFLFKKVHARLEKSVTAKNFALFCTPVVNLFEKTLDRVHVSDETYEYHLVSDRARPLDFEVYQITKMIGYGAQIDQGKEFFPFYLARDYQTDKDRSYYVINRVPRLISEREKRLGRRSSSYPGSELYASLVDSECVPFSRDLKQLGVEALCSNRDLPIFMPLGQGESDFSLEQAAPCSSIHSIKSFSPPRTNCAEGKLRWRAIDHLSLNYLSLIKSDGAGNASILREILSLYAETHNLQIQKQLEGIKSVDSRPITRRILASGYPSFVRGIEITVTLEENQFAGTGVFLFGVILDQYFSRFIAINSFTETVIKTMERGEIIRWPARTGTRHII
jgi:type VI secretion system protein ImpG